MSELDELLGALEAAAAGGDEGGEAAGPNEAAVVVLARQLANSDQLETASGAQALRAARALSQFAPPQALTSAAELAARAHQSGVDGAGTLFAECVDKMHLLSGRAQRFGTAVTRHQGDLMIAPSDAGVDDDTRQQLGLPSFEQLRLRVHRRNQTEATERAQTANLPAGQRFARIWRDPSEEELEVKLDEHCDQPANQSASGTAGAVGAAWAEGDELTLCAKSASAFGLIAGPVFELPLWRARTDEDGAAELSLNPNGGEQLWSLSVRVERLSEAVIGYGFWELDENGGLSGGAMRGPVDHRFRGPDAPPELPSTPNDQLAGEVSTEPVSSTALRENRLVTVYLPPGHTPQEKLPVIYATDGAMMAPYIRRIDAAITADELPRCVLIAAHSAPMSSYSNERALEYLPGFDDKRFDRHQQFFVTELTELTEERFGVSAERSQRAVFGVSDGGGHCLATGHMNRERFGHSIAYSTGLPPNEKMGWEADKAPFVHLCAGTLEGGFFDATYAWSAWLHFSKSPHHWTERVCGHDLIQWVEELPRSISRAWG